MPTVSSELDSLDSYTEDVSSDADEDQCVSCNRPGHIHRQHRTKIYDLSEEDLLLEEDEMPFEERDVHISKERNMESFYDLLEVLGKGKFGLVCRCEEKSTKKLLAAKFIDIRRPQERKEVEAEVALMRILRHPRLLQLYDAFDAGKSMIIIMELASGGELFSRVIDQDFVLTEKVCASFMRQICEGVEFMHSKNVIHLDLKPENVLCVSPTSNRIKLIDFGLSRLYTRGEVIRVFFGTPEFVAPEVIAYDPITPASDMWSVGVICYILLSGLSPFMGDEDCETLANVTQAAWDFEDECFDTISEEARDFITQLLRKDPIKRMTATACLRHPWLVVKKPTATNENELSKAKLRRFVIRRRWQKLFNTVRALRRMGSNLSHTDEECDRESPIQTHGLESLCGVPAEEASSTCDCDRDHSESENLSSRLEPTDNREDPSPQPSPSLCSFISQDSGLDLASPTPTLDEGTEPFLVMNSGTTSPALQSCDEPLSESSASVKELVPAPGDAVMDAPMIGDHFVRERETLVRDEIMEPQRSKALTENTTIALIEISPDCENIRCCSEPCLEGR